jgi:glycosyltransferase involved in cell wall biosynthesis
MRILIVTQYFWPENFRINDLSLALTERGHTVEVLTGKPNYGKNKFYDNYSFFNKPSEVWNNIKIHRSPLIVRGNAGGIRLMLNYLSFALFASFRALSVKGQFDKIFVYEPSPITVGLPALVLKLIKRAPVYFWVQDLWPHSVTAAGGFNNRVIINILNNVTRWIYKKSDKILIQSEAFREIILSQGVADSKIIYYPNSVEAIFNIRSIQPEFANKLPDGFKIMFAGNIGEAQDFETLLKAACIVKESNETIKWVVLGNGRKREFVENKIKELSLKDHFFLLGDYPIDYMPSFFACADCLLVSLKKNHIFSLTVPSKLQSYLACGKPIIASLDGEGVKILRNAKAGLVSESENPVLLAQRVLEMNNLSHSELKEMGRNARAFFDANFERELLVTRLEDIFAENE